jgi:hypothetical protein
MVVKDGFKLPTEVNALLLASALLPIDVILDKSIDLSPVSLHAQLPKVVKFGRLIVYKLLQPPIPPVSIVVIPSVFLIVVSEVHPLNMFCLNLSVPTGRVTSVNYVQPEQKLD